MNLNIDYDALENCGDVSKINAEKLLEQIKIWEENIDYLKKIWQGEDAEIFFDKADNYLKNAETLSMCMDTIGSFMKSATNRYYEEEEVWSKEVERERNEDYEQQ